MEKIIYFLKIPNIIRFFLIRLIDGPSMVNREWEKNGQSPHKSLIFSTQNRWPSMAHRCAKIEKTVLFRHPWSEEAPFFSGPRGFDQKNAQFLANMVNNFAHFLKKQN